MIQNDRHSIGVGFRAARLLILAWFSLLFFRLSLSLTGYNVAKRFLRENDANLDAAPAAFAYRVSQAITHASKFTPRASCLVRAMAAKFLLDRRDYESSICVGVAKDAGRPLRAHAWLKSGDFIIVGDEKRQLSRYAPLAKSV